MGDCFFFMMGCNSRSTTLLLYIKLNLVGQKRKVDEENGSILSAVAMLYFAVSEFFIIALLGVWVWHIPQ